ncbi:MAG: homospermidine synthase, partial [Rhodobacteraceae bacterium]
MTTYPDYGQIDGPIVIIGFGSIGRGTLPLIERHFEYDAKQVYVIEPELSDHTFLAQRGIHHIEQAVTRENYRELLGGLFKQGKGFCVNLSVDTSSLDIMKLCREMGVLYIDTVVEPWAGFYFETEDNARRTNYALRQAVRDEKARNPGGTTAISCCGANPGMVSWFVKEALMILARDTGRMDPMPTTREGWARLMQSLGVKGVHIAERDTQKSTRPKKIGTFVNTWSVEGFISEGFQPAELGWGTHERWFPENAHGYDTGCQAAIWMERPGAITRVHTWCPTPGPQYGFLVTHNEAISISDYYTVGDPGAPEYRPTCHYAYHPSDDAILSLHETFGSGIIQQKHHILDENEITEGKDELGVLLYG